MWFASWRCRTSRERARLGCGPSHHPVSPQLRSDLLTKVRRSPLRDQAHARGRLRRHSEPSATSRSQADGELEAVPTRPTEFPPAPRAPTTAPPSGSPGDADDSDVDDELEVLPPMPTGPAEPAAPASESAGDVPVSEPAASPPASALDASASTPRFDAPSCAPDARRAPAATAASASTRRRPRRPRPASAAALRAAAAARGAGDGAPRQWLRRRVAVVSYGVLGDAIAAAARPRRARRPARARAIVDPAGLTFVRAGARRGWRPERSTATVGCAASSRARCAARSRARRRAPPLRARRGGACDVVHVVGPDLRAGRPSAAAGCAARVRVQRGAARVVRVARGGGGAGAPPPPTTLRLLRSRRHFRGPVLGRCAAAHAPRAAARLRRAARGDAARAARSGAARRAVRF